MRDKINKNLNPLGKVIRNQMSVPGLISDSCMPGPNLTADASGGRVYRRAIEHITGKLIHFRPHPF